MPQPRALIPACLLHHDSQYREASGEAGLPCCLQGFGESLSPALSSTERLFLAPLLHLQLLPVLLRASPELSLPCCWSSLGGLLAGDRSNLHTKPSRWMLTHRPNKNQAPVAAWSWGFPWKTSLCCHPAHQQGMGSVIPTTLQCQHPDAAPPRKGALPAALCLGRGPGEPGARALRIRPAPA